MRMEEEYYMEEEVPRRRAPMEYYMEEDMEDERDEMERYEMEPWENRENMGYEARRFRHRHPYRYTCPERVRRC